MLLYIYKLLVLSVVRFEIKCSLHVFSSINVVVYTTWLHCTLQANLVQVILYLRFLLFMFISFVYNLYKK